MFWLLLTYGLLAWISYLLILQQRPKNFPPGPRGWPLVGNLFQLGVEPHKGICNIGKKFGRIFTLNFGSFPVVILNHPETIRKALTSDGFEGRPTHLPMMNVLERGISFSTGDIWREQRRFCLHKLRDFGFGKTSMQDVIVDDVSEVVQHLKNLKGTSMYPADLFGTLAVNTLWHLVAGRKYPLNDPDVVKMQHYGHEAFEVKGATSVVYFMPQIVSLFPGLVGFNTCKDYAKKLLDLIWEMGVKNAETFDPDNERHFMDSFWKKIKETTDPSSTFDEQKGETSFKHTLGTLFIAGSDTLSSTMSWVILYLGLHPEKCGRLYKEIVEVIGETGTPTKDHLLRMPYTQATMQEVNRLASVVPNSVLYATTKNVTFEEYTLPKGTIVLANLYGAHHDPEIWGDPEAFRPERFLDEGGNFIKSEAVMPFGVGKRACLAEPMAMTQFFIYLTTVVQNFKFEFDMEKCGGSLPKLGETQGTGLTLHPKPYYVKFVARQGFGNDSDLNTDQIILV